MTTAAIESTTDRTNQEQSAKANPTGIFWMVWREGGNRPRQRHTDYESAAFEANRIAANHPGANTYVMQAIEHYKTEGIKPAVIKTAVG